MPKQKQQNSELGELAQLVQILETLREPGRRDQILGLEREKFEQQSDLENRRLMAATEQFNRQDARMTQDNLLDAIGRFSMNPNFDSDTLIEALGPMIPGLSDILAGARRRKQVGKGSEALGLLGPGADVEATLGSFPPEVQSELREQRRKKITAQFKQNAENALGSFVPTSPPPDIELPVGNAYGNLAKPEPKKKKPTKTAMNPYSPYNPQ